MKQYIPIYKRSPNKFLYYSEELFNDNAGHSAILTIAHFTDKNKQYQTYIAFVKWIQL